MAKKGWTCPQCDTPVSDANQVEKVGRWVVEARCKPCGVKVIITKGKTKVKR